MSVYYLYVSENKNTGETHFSVVDDFLGMTKMYQNARNSNGLRRICIYKMLLNLVTLEIDVTLLTTHAWIN